jgi:hypothetical protein
MRTTPKRAWQCHQLWNNVNEGRQRTSRVARLAQRRDNTNAFERGSTREFAQQPRFADTRFAMDQVHAAITAARISEGDTERGHLRTSANERGLLRCRNRSIGVRLGDPSSERRCRNP